MRCSRPIAAASPIVISPPTADVVPAAMSVLPKSSAEAGLPKPIATSPANVASTPST